MIRINLLPSKKRSPRGGAASTGQWVALVMVGGWILLGAGGYWLVAAEEARANEIRAEAAKKKARVEEIRKLIDEEGLQARQDKVEQLRTAIEKLKSQQRSPVYVMHEVANILTTGKMPEVDEEEQRRLEAADPQSKLISNWDATSVWLMSLNEDGGGGLAVAGSARDAADLAEFTRRLRASSRFGNVSHPDFQRVSANDAGSRYVTFKVDVAVERWD